MKKISLLDKFRLTDLFLQGMVSMVMDQAIDATGKDSVMQDGRYFEFSDGERVHCRYAVGDALPVMMSYGKAGLDYKVFGNTRGWQDKKSADAVYMPHKLVVESVRCVRVQDLTEEDALRTGLHRNHGGYYMVGGACGGADPNWKVMFSRFFDMLFGKPYALNPWVIVYEMKPVIVGRVVLSGTEFVVERGCYENS